MTVNIDPARWGKHLWKSLHYLAYAFPMQPNTEQKQAALQMLNALSYLLPCAKCRMHYGQFLQANPPDVESRERFARYLNTLHNSVNARLGKELIDYDPDLAYGKKGNDWTRILIAVVIGIVIGLLVRSLMS